MDNVETYFFISINKDGTLGTMADVPETLPERERSATNYDVYQTSKQIAEEFEQTLLARRVAQEVASMLTPPADSVSDKVKDALRERGVNVG
jgi:hypothetical protein